MNFKIKEQENSGSGKAKNLILPIFYELMKGLQKQGLSYQVIKELNVNEVWHFYADYINELQYSRYLQNPPYEADGKKVKQYDFDIITIEKNNG